MAITKKQSAELARQAFECAPAPEAIDHVKIQPRHGLFIGGRMVEAHSKKHFPTINPATEKTLSQVVDADEVDVDRAVKAAGKAFDSWARLSPSRRSRYLFRISRLLQERSRELAVVETMDGGKPIKESRDVDIPLSAAHFFYYAGWADKLEWAFPNRKTRPLGVAGQVIPWNFPLLMLAWKIAPALAAGNTVVLKPAETTPRSALLFADICMQAALPPRVVDIVTGGGQPGARGVAHHGAEKAARPGPSGATGFRPRCSPMCRSRTASRARRSSARCCRCSPSARPRRRSRRRTTRHTACRPACGRTRARASCGWRSACVPVSCGPTRSTDSTPPHPSAATRSRASDAKAAGTACCLTW